MTISDTFHLARLWAIGAGAVVATVCAVALATGSSANHGSVLSQLERPASFPALSVGPGATSTAITAGAYSLRLELGPNRASRPDGVTLRVMRGGHPVTANVKLTYGMPAMNMSNVLSSQLRPTMAGDYRTIDPQLSMAGRWQLRFDVAPAGDRPFTVVVNDQMGL